MLLLLSLVLSSLFLILLLSPSGAWESARGSNSAETPHLWRTRRSARPGPAAWTGSGQSLVQIVVIAISIVAIISISSSDNANSDSDSNSNDIHIIHNDYYQ